LPGGVPDGSGGEADQRWRSTSAARSQAFLQDSLPGRSVTGMDALVHELFARAGEEPLC